MNRKAKGRAGEDRAAVLLTESGYRVLERNFRGRSGEIDIIALDGQRLVFIEVKTWDTYSEDALEHAVGRVKQKKIVNTARLFLVLNPEYTGIEMRFDVMLLLNNLEKIVHIKDAFGAAHG